jgi:hypothetical protein
LYGKYLSGTSQHLHERVREIEAGAYDDAMAELRGLSVAQLRARYEEREIEE